jgi:hypothetical protein
VGPTENPLPPALHATREQKLTGILTGAVLHFTPQPGRTSPALGWSVIAVKPVGIGEGGVCCGAVTELLTKNIKTDIKWSFFDVVSGVQKDSDDVSVGIGKFLRNPIYKNFVQNLKSKLVRSTLTSPGRIRVKGMWSYSCSNFWVIYAPCRQE